MVLRNYQQYAVDKILETVDNLFSDDEIILSSCTSFGKSLVVSELCQRLDGNIVIVVSFTPLVEQIEEHLVALGIEHSILKAGMEDKFDESQRIQLVMAQTYYARLDKVTIHADYVLMDEFHVSYKTKRFNSIIDRLQPDKVIGFTATSFRAIGTKLSNTAEVITTATTKDLVKQGFLCPVNYYIPRWAERIDYSGVKSTSSDYTGSSLDEVVNTHSHITKVVGSMNHMNAKNKKTLVFCSTIEHCDAVTAALKADGYLAEAYHSKVSKKDSESIMDAFKHNKESHISQKEIAINRERFDEKSLIEEDNLPPIEERKVTCLVSVSRLQIGFSVSDIELGVMLRPTKIYSLFVQQAGRMRRIHESKIFSEILDLSQCLSRFGFDDNEYSPPDHEEDNKENRRNVAIELSEQAMPLLTEFLPDDEEPQLVTRQFYTERMEDLNKIEDKPIEQLSGEQLMQVFATTSDVAKLIAIGARIWEARFGQPISKAGRPYTLSPQWLSEDAIVIMDKYPENSIKWLKSHRTRIKNICKGDVTENKGLSTRSYKGAYAKNYNGVRFFAAYLESSYLDEMSTQDSYSSFQSSGAEKIYIDEDENPIPF